MDDSTFEFKPMTADMFDHFLEREPIPNDADMFDGNPRPEKAGTDHDMFDRCNDPQVLSIDDEMFDQYIEPHVFDTESNTFEVNIDPRLIRIDVNEFDSDSEPQLSGIDTNLRHDGMHPFMEEPETADNEAPTLTQEQVSRSSIEDNQGGTAPIESNPNCIHHTKEASNIDCPRRQNYVQKIDVPGILADLHERAEEKTAQREPSQPVLCIENNGTLDPSNKVEQDEFRTSTDVEIVATEPHIADIPDGKEICAPCKDAGKMDCDGGNPCDKCDEEFQFCYPQSDLSNDKLFRDWTNPEDPEWQPSLPRSTVDCQTQAGLETAPATSGATLSTGVDKATSAAEKHGENRPDTTGSREQPEFIQRTAILKPKSRKGLYKKPRSAPWMFYDTGPVFRGDSVSDSTARNADKPPLDLPGAHKAEPTSSVISETSGKNKFDPSSAKETAALQEPPVADNTPTVHQPLPVENEADVNESSPAQTTPSKPKAKSIFEKDYTDTESSIPIGTCVNPFSKLATTESNCISDGSSQESEPVDFKNIKYPTRSGSPIQTEKQCTPQ